MKIKTHYQLTDLEGEVIQDPEKVNKKLQALQKEGLSNFEINEQLQKEDCPLTLGTMCARALVNHQEGKTVPGDEMVKRYELAKKFMTQKEVNLPAEDITLVKQSVEVFCTILTYPQIAERLDPK